MSWGVGVGPRQYWPIFVAGHSKPFRSVGRLLTHSPTRGGVVEPRWHARAQHEGRGLGGGALPELVLVCDRVRNELVRRAIRPRPRIPTATQSCTARAWGHAALRPPSPQPAPSRALHFAGGCTLTFCAAADAAGAAQAYINDYRTDVRSYDLADRQHRQCAPQPRRCRPGPFKLAQQFDWKSR